MSISSSHFYFLQFHVGFYKEILKTLFLGSPFLQSFFNLRPSCYTKIRISDILKPNLIIWRAAIRFKFESRMFALPTLFFVLIIACKASASKHNKGWYIAQNIQCLTLSRHQRSCTHRHNQSTILPFRSVTQIDMNITFLESRHTWCVPI